MLINKQSSQSRTCARLFRDAKKQTRKYIYLLNYGETNYRLTMCVDFWIQELNTGA